MSRVTDIMADLAACMCIELEREGVAPLCFCGIVHGEAADQGYVGTCTGKCGMAWVRLSSAYPANVPGSQQEEPNTCGTMLGLEFELAVMRCAPMPDARGNPPTPAQIAEAVAVQTDDMLAIRKAIQCCSALESGGYRLGNYLPAGPSGGFIGGSWGLAVTL